MRNSRRAWRAIPGLLSLGLFVLSSPDGAAAPSVLAADPPVAGEDSSGPPEIGTVLGPAPAGDPAAAAATPATVDPVPAAAAPASVAAAPAPAAVDPAVRVELTLVQPLRLVRYQLRGQPLERGPALAGALAVTLHNPSAFPVTVWVPGVGGLRFEAADGTAHVLVHPCDCPALLGEAPPPGGEGPGRLLLAPGERRRLDFADWGCSGGSWAPPPPGAYRVVYRLLPEAPVAAPGGSPDAARWASLNARCRARLLDPGLWAGGAVSPPLELRLEPPVPEAVHP